MPSPALNVAQPTVKGKRFRPVDISSSGRRLLSLSFLNEMFFYYFFLSLTGVNSFGKL